MQQGDRSALRAIYQTYKGDLLTVATYLLTDVASAEDVLHDVLVDFAANVRGFTLRSSLKGYLATCVANRARDRLRRRSRNDVSLSAGLDAPDDTPDPVGQIISDEQARRLWERVAGLPEEQREVITLHVHAGLPFREIAEHQGVSISTAQSRYRYAIERLRSLLRAEVGT